MTPGFGRRQLPLIERDELPGKRAAVLGVEGAIDVLENYAGLIVVAVVDEVAFIFVARQTVIDRDLGMARADGGSDRTHCRCCGRPGNANRSGRAASPTFGLTIESL